jgi:hypothetical protein
MNWTPRNTVNVVVAALCAIALVVLQSGAVHGTWVTTVTALLSGVLIGLVTPGSPVGRYLDSLVPEAPPVGQPPTNVSGR